MRKLSSIIIAIMTIAFAITAEASTATWDPVNGAIGYTLRCTDTETDSEYIKSTAQTSVDIDLEPGHAYECTVEAYNAVEKSGLSNRVVHEVPPTYVPPDDVLPAISTDAPRAPTSLVL